MTNPLEKEGGDQPVETAAEKFEREQAVERDLAAERGRAGQAAARERAAKKAQTPESGS